MANYPDIPGARMAYDLDGTVGLSIDSAGTSFVTLSNANMRAMNNTDVADFFQLTNTGMIALLFPELRDLTGSFRCISAGTTIETSTDTTNGFDGVWTNRSTSGQGSTTIAVTPQYRTTIHSFTANGVKGIRSKSGGNSAINHYGWHVYGAPSAATDRLELWHPTLNQALSVTPTLTDFGDRMRNGGPFDITFRIKNMSSTLTAGTIVCGVEALTDASSPTHVSEFTLKYDSGSFATTATLSSLAPNTVSGAVFTLRWAPGITSALGLWDQRLTAIASTWT